MSNAKPGEDEQPTIYGGPGGPDDGRTTSTPIGGRAAGGQTGAQEADRFTLRQVLGEGSQGEVCRAFDNHLQREVAIKFPHRSAGDQEAIEILDEARKAARLNHPNAVTVYECGWWQGRPFICMELVQGLSLAQLLKECGRVSVERWVRYGRQILGALKAAHAVGLVHRDLKPQNVIVSTTGELKLTDFGIAHVARGPKTRKTSVNNVLAGTPMYMSPEQWNGETPDARSDIYAFGCMSYVMLSGRGPFPCENPMQEHLEATPPSLRERVPDVPRAVDEVVRRCLAKRPEDRFASCDDLLFAIERALREGSTETAAVAPKGRTSPKGGRGKFVALGLVGLLLVGAAGFAFSPPGRRLVERWRGGAGDPGTENGGEHTPSDTTRERLVALLAEARDTARTPEERIASAEAIQSLVPSGPEWDEASSIITEARQRIRQMTESQITEGFEATLARARSAVEEGRLDAARGALEEAEAAMGRHDLLLSRKREVLAVALPYHEALGDRAAAAGAFGEARDHFLEGKAKAEQIGDAARKERLDRRAATAQLLARCDAVVQQEPRYVVLELARMAEAGRLWPARQLLEAEAELRLDRRDLARRLVGDLAMRNDLAPDLASRVRALDELLR
ncbi:MAG: serine/threonine-protein kinase [Planctomycetota bacterium]